MIVYPSLECLVYKNFYMQGSVTNDKSGSISYNANFICQVPIGHIVKSSELLNKRCCSIRTKIELFKQFSHTACDFQ